jgi:hypothetical protein
MIGGTTNHKLRVVEGSATSRIYRVGRNVIAVLRGKANLISRTVGRAADIKEAPIYNTQQRKCAMPGIMMVSRTTSLTRR